MLQLSHPMCMHQAAACFEHQVARCLLVCTLGCAWGMQPVSITSSDWRPEASNCLALVARCSHTTQ